MTKEYKGYSLFNDVENVLLQTFNRCATYFNIVQDVGMDAAKGYIKGMDDLSRHRMYRMFDDIRDRGYSSVRQEVISSRVKH